MKPELAYMTHGNKMAQVQGKKGDTVFDGDSSNGGVNRLHLDTFLF